MTAKFDYIIVELMVVVVVVVISIISVTVIVIAVVKILLILDLVVIIIIEDVISMKPTTMKNVMGENLAVPVLSTRACIELHYLN